MTNWTNANGSVLRTRFLLLRSRNDDARLGGGGGSGGGAAATTAAPLTKPLSVISNGAQRNEKSGALCEHVARMSNLSYTLFTTKWVFSVF